LKKQLLLLFCLLLACLSACSTPIPLHPTVISPLPFQPAQTIPTTETPEDEIEETPEPHQETPPPNTGDIMVWQSRTGTKYHSIPDCGSMNPNNAKQITLEEAKARGLKPCSLCGPPQ